MIRSMEEFTSAFHAARCVSTPLVAVRTADPASTTHFIIETLKQGRELPPMVGWDVVRGLYAIGRDGGEELARMLGERQAATIGRSMPCFWRSSLARTAFLLYSNAHRFWNDPGVMQGIWDLRDSFKATGRMLVLQASRYIVPVSRSATEQIKALRQMASGKFISASTPGVYQYEENTPAPRRRIMRDLGGPPTVMPPSKSEA